MKTIETIYRENYQYVFNYVNSKVNNVDAAKELANDVFLKANRLLNTYDEKKSKVTTWLRIITNSAVIDYYRTDHSGRNINVSDFTDSEGKETFSFVGSKTNEANFEVENNELGSSLDRAFSSLNPRLREVAELFFKSEKKYEEIAEILNIPMGSVKAYINRARAALQSELVAEKKAYC